MHIQLSWNFVPSLAAGPTPHQKEQWEEGGAMFSPSWGVQCADDFPFISTKPKAFAKNIDESHCPGAVAKHPCHICPIRM